MQIHPGPDVEGTMRHAARFHPSRWPSPFSLLAFLPAVLLAQETVGSSRVPAPGVRVAAAHRFVQSRIPAVPVRVHACEPSRMASLAAPLEGVQLSALEPRPWPEPPLPVTAHSPPGAGDVPAVQSPDIASLAIDEGLVLPDPAPVPWPTPPDVTAGGQAERLATGEPHAPDIVAIEVPWGAWPRATLEPVPWPEPAPVEGAGWGSCPVA